MKTPEQFRAAVEQIIGTPAGPDFVYEWNLDTPHGLLWVSRSQIDDADPFTVFLRFPESRPGLGESPMNGKWNILGRLFNNDPDAVLLELTRRLAAAGYVPPAPVSITLRVKGYPSEPESPERKALRAMLDTVYDEERDDETIAAVAMARAVLAEPELLTPDSVGSKLGGAPSAETFAQMLQNGQGRFAYELDQLVERRSREVLRGVRGLLSERDALKAERDRLRETLEWYGEQARLARLIHAEGDAGRQAIDRDGGKKAREALAGKEPS